MPCAIVHTNVKLEETKAKQFISSLSKSLSKLLNKPESYVMVSLTYEVMCFGGSENPCAFIELFSIGSIDASKNQKTSQSLTATVNELTGIDQSRVYINFTDAKPYNWGFNGGTF